MSYQDSWWFTSGDNPETKLKELVGMNFENVLRLESVMVGRAAKPGALMDALKVFNPEKSTEEYNMHPIVRTARIDRERTAFILAEKPNSAGGVTDEYLTYVLAFYQGQYVTWLCNHSAGGFHYGRYHGGDFSGAMTDFLTRNHEDIVVKAKPLSEVHAVKVLKEWVDHEHKHWDSMSDTDGHGSCSYGRWAALDDVKDQITDMLERSNA